MLTNVESNENDAALTLILLAVLIATGCLNEELEDTGANRRRTCLIIL